MDELENLINDIRRDPSTDSVHIHKHVRKMLGRETVLCSAIKFRDRIFYGHRHNHCLAAFHDRFSYSYNRKQLAVLDREIVQGFVTNRGRFVNRKQGRKLQESAGIKSKSKDGYRGDELYSEDLY